MRSRTRRRTTVTATVLGIAALATAASAATGSAPASTPGAAAGAGPAQRVVLPDAVTPVRYRIDITPDAGTLSFSGRVDIDVMVHRPTAQIVLNSVDLAIDAATLDDDPGRLALRFDTTAETAAFTFAQPLRRGAHTLHLAYRGRINEQGFGLFSLEYETADGKRRALFTKFENSDARRFVPCWDEPGRKATFELTVVVPEDLTALSNTPIAATERLAGQRKRVRFAATPRMSSYLLFFGLGDFERVHRDVDGVDVGVVVKRGDTSRAEFALDAAAQILPYYNRYFGTAYPLPKLDLIAGPGSSQRFSAMENWGAIFYFERAILIDPRISTEADRQNVYEVIAHEMAHQWFGDLVTMAWWDDLWLNEGFASWMQLKVTDHFHPEWKVWLQSLAATQSAMDVDARDGTHPVITPIRDVQQANGAFDSITYSKGAAVIRMLEDYLGEHAFRAGVRRYMRAHALGNTVTDDLWLAIDQGSARPITQIAHDFTLQAGVPLVRALDSSCAHGVTTVRLDQERFAIDAESTSARTWHVPVRLAGLDGNGIQTLVSTSAPTTVRIRGCGVLLLNGGQSGYFRSRYDASGQAALTTHLAELPSIDQLGILSDTLSLGYVGAEPMAAFLELTRSLPVAADPLVITALVGRLRGLDRIYEDLPGQPAFRVYARQLLQPMFAHVTWDRVSGQSDNTATLRSALIAGLGEFGDAAVLEEARRRFGAFLLDPSSLDAAARRNVLRTVALEADAQLWDQLHALARSAKSFLERQEFYNLLGAARDPALADRALELALSGEPPTTVAPEMINAVSRLHPARAFEFAVAHWDRVEDLVEPNIRSRYVPRLIAGATDANLIDAANRFGEAHIPPGGRLELRKAIANVRYLAAIRRARIPEVDEWLRTRAAP